MALCLSFCSYMHFIYSSIISKMSVAIQPPITQVRRGAECKRADGSPVAQSAAQSDTYLNDTHDSRTEVWARACVCGSTHHHICAQNTRKHTSAVVDRPKFMRRQSNKPRNVALANAESAMYVHIRKYTYRCWLTHIISRPRIWVICVCCLVECNVFSWRLSIRFDPNYTIMSRNLIHMQFYYAMMNFN